MNWTDQQLAEYERERKGVAPLRSKKVLPRSEMNKGESVYKQWLEILQKGDLIIAWFFQSWTFKLASDCRYTPDFAVLRFPHQWTLVDVKGRKVKPDGSQTYWAEEDAKIKIKVAAKMFPMFRWVIAFPLQNGEWQEVEIRGH